MYIGVSNNNIISEYTLNRYIYYDFPERFRIEVWGGLPFLTQQS